MPVTDNKCTVHSHFLAVWPVFVERALEAMTTTGPPYVCLCNQFSFRMFVCKLRQRSHLPLENQRWHMKLASSSWSSAASAAAAYSNHATRKELCRHLRGPASKLPGHLEVGALFGTNVIHFCLGLGKVGELCPQFYHLFLQVCGACGSAVSLVGKLSNSSLEVSLLCFCSGHLLIAI